jgi:ribonuclease HII
MGRLQLTLAQIRVRYVDRARPMPAAVEEALRADARAGAAAILAAVEKRRHANRAEGQRLRGMLRYETQLWEAGISEVAGIDEAGMSPLAGPVAAAAVILRPGTRIPGVDDSKKLDAAERERLAPIIKQQAVAWAVSFTEPDEIDRLNIYWAGIAAMKRALMALAVSPRHLLIDARKLKDVPLPQQAIVGGDRKSLTIAAASILAKTARDQRMRELDGAYPGYGFAKHKGYPVKAHFAALKKLGACDIHRRSFTPVRIALGLPLTAQMPLPGMGDAGDGAIEADRRAAEAEG